MNQQLQQALAAFGAATNNNLYDAEWNGGTWMVEAVETRETIDDFVAASSKYAECTREKFGEVAGFKFVAFREIQVRKGDARRQLSVIDFGDVRFAIDADLTSY